MCTENLKNLVASLVAFLLSAAPVAASAGSEAARTVATGDPTMPAMLRLAAPRVDGAWVEYDRGAGLTEWFINLPRGITTGCDTEPQRYCPAALVTRQQMAAFVTRMFGLTLYGP